MTPTYTGGITSQIIFSKYFLLYFDFRLNLSEWQIVNVLIKKTILIDLI